MNTLNGYSKSTLTDKYVLTAAGGHFPIHSGRNNEANKLVRTDANGYLNAGWINTTSGAFTGTPSRIYASNDAYIRYMTPANFFPTLTNTSNLLDITIGGLNRKLTIDYSKVSGSTKTLDYKSLPSTTSNASNTVWCSFARIAFNTGAWVAANGYIFLGDAESYGYSGILYYEFRSSSTATAIGKASLLWLVKNKDTASIIAVKVKDNIYDLYINNYSTYSCPIIYHMSSTISRFTWNVGSWTTTKPTAAYTASDTGRVNYANSANSATQVIVNLHTANNTEYPLVWSNSASTSTTTGNLLYKSYSHLTYNPSAHRISTGQYIANNSSGPHFTANSTAGNWAYLRLHNGSTYWDIATRSTSGSGGLWLARLSGADNGIFVSTGNNVGISTSSPSYKLHVAGDAYATGWSRAGSGFYVEGKGVHYMSNNANGLGLIYLTSNEFNWSASGAALYFNYRASANGTTVTLYIWNAGSSSTYASHTLGALTSRSDLTLYGLTQTCNKANDANYMNSALQIREYNFGGAQSDTWAIAPRLSWHWSGRVQTQIGLNSSGDLKLSKDLFATSYLLLHLGNSSVSGGGSSGGSSITVNIGNNSKTLTIPTSLPANGGTSSYTKYLKIHDVRGTNHLPNSSTYPEKNITAWFNNTGTPDGSWWSGITVKGWTSDYSAWLLCSYSSTGTANNYGLYVRNGVSSGWGSWRVLLDSGNSSIGDYNVKINGTTKQFVRDWGHGAANMNAVARGGRSSMGMADLSTPSGGTATAVNPNGGTSWHHFINIAYTDGGAGSNSWITQIANKAGTTDLWVRSRSGGTISDTANWAAGWTRILTGTNYTHVLDSRYVNTAGDTMTGPLTFANGTWNVVGDDAAIGDYNAAGMLGLKSINNNIPGIGFHNKSNTLLGRLQANGSNLLWNDNKIWHAGNDGSGSGLDADTVDGYHRSNLFTSYVTWMDVSGLNKSITVGGNADTYYPVVISVSSSKLDSTRISVWKNLGSTTPSYSGNHSNGTSSLWLIYEGRNWMWDGNGGFIKTWYKHQSYATLIAHAELAGSGVGNLVLYLRGGGCLYNIACSNSFTATVYTASTNIGSSSYPVNVAPRTTIGNGGIIENRLGYGFVDSASTATLASTVTVNNSDANSTYRMVWHSGNTLYGTGGIYCNPSTDCLYASHYYETSDIAFKTNIEPILNSDNMPVLKSFDWKSDGSHSYGLIALELEDMGYPELVSEGDGYKTVNYSAALSLIVGKLQVKIKELEKEIEILKNKN